MHSIAGSTVIKFTNTDPALLSVDGMVEEQDTNLLLGKSPVVSVTIDSFPALIQKMETQMPQLPGNVIVKHTKPRRFIAIIYDVEQEPICQEIWIRDVLKQLIDYCEQYQIKTLGMPLLGNAYGKITETTSQQLLQQVLLEYRHQYPKKILIYRFTET